MPKVIWFFKNEAKREEKDVFQQELRSVFVLLIGTVILFELIGLHPIIAGFFTGLVLSDSITSSILKAKIRAVGYGIFVPAFFISVGAKTDLNIFVENKDILWFSFMLVTVSIVVKFAAGYLGARYLKMNKNDSKIFASSLIPQLSTTLAVATIGMELKILSLEIFSSVIMISIITVLVSPLLIKIYVKKSEKKNLESVKI